MFASWRHIPYHEDMELHPDGDELRLNEQLSGFAKRILDNDLLAMAIVKRSNERAPQGEGWQYSASEPSLCVLEDGKFSAGIQVGYRSYNPEYRSTASKYIYTDFFIIDQENSSYELSDELKAVIEDVGEQEVEELIETAWQLWLTELHSMVDRVNATRKEGFIPGQPDAMKLFVDKYTGEIAFGYNIPPGHAVEIALPPLGQSFKN